MFSTGRTSSAQVMCQRALTEQPSSWVAAERRHPRRPTNTQRSWVSALLMHCKDQSTQRLEAHIL